MSSHEAPSPRKPADAEEAGAENDGKEKDDAEAAALLRRLQAQFGDIDVSTVMNTSHGGAGVVVGVGSDLTDAADNKDEDPKQQDAEEDDDDEEGKHLSGVEEVESEESEESSVVEDPSPEELRIWQEAQYKLAEWAKEGRETDGDGMATAATAAMGSGGGGGEVVEDGKDDWVRVEGPPDLDGQESAFFVGSGSTTRSTTTSSNAAATPAASPNNNNSEKTDRLLAEIAAADPEALGGKWRRLYSSNDDGLSYARLLSSLRGYDGPTVLLIGTVPSHAHRIPSGSSGNTNGGSGTARNKTGTMGLYTATPWRESGTYYGTDRCFLFRVDDSHYHDRHDHHARDEEVDLVHVFRPTEGGGGNDHKQRFMFCRSTTPAAISADTRIAVEQAQALNSSIGSADNVPAGIGIGGGAAGYGPRLHITESLEACRALPYDGTFDAGPLLPPFFGGGSGSSSAGEGGTSEGGGLHYFDVDVMEAWGVGGGEAIQSALKARGKDRELADAAMHKIRQVDRMQFVDHFKSDIVHGKVFAHHQQIQGHCGLEDEESLESTAI